MTHEEEAQKRTWIFSDSELLEQAHDADDPVSLCERISHKYGLELTLEEAHRLILIAGGEG